MTPKMRKFVDGYSGNGVQAARAAGYTGAEAVLANTASRLLRHPEIAKAVQEREEKERNSLVADRIERQALWTKVMRSDEVPLSDRLRASELLAKSSGDFLERHEVVGAVMPTDQLLALMKAKKDRNESA